MTFMCLGKVQNKFLQVECKKIFRPSQCVHVYIVHVVELRCWSGYGTLFTRLDNYRFSFILLTVDLFRHPTLNEHGLKQT